MASSRVQVNPELVYEDQNQSRLGIQVSREVKLAIQSELNLLQQRNHDIEIQPLREENYQIWFQFSGDTTLKTDICEKLNYYKDSKAYATLLAVESDIYLVCETNRILDNSGFCWKIAKHGREGNFPTTFLKRNQIPKGKGLMDIIKDLQRPKELEEGIKRNLFTLIINNDSLLMIKRGSTLSAHCQLNDSNHGIIFMTQDQYEASLQQLSGDGIRDGYGTRFREGYGTRFQEGWHRGREYRAQSTPRENERFSEPSFGNTHSVIQTRQQSLQVPHGGGGASYLASDNESTGPVPMEVDMSSINKSINLIKTFTEKWEVYRDNQEERRKVEEEIEERRYRLMKEARDCSEVVTAKVEQNTQITTEIRAQISKMQIDRKNEAEELKTLSTKYDNLRAQTDEILDLMRYLIIERRPTTNVVMPAASTTCPAISQEQLERSAAAAAAVLAAPAAGAAGTAVSGPGTAVTAATEVTGTLNVPPPTRDRTGPEIIVSTGEESPDEVFNNKETSAATSNQLKPIEPLMSINSVASSSESQTPKSPHPVEGGGNITKTYSLPPPGSNVFSFSGNSGLMDITMPEVSTNNSAETHRSNELLEKTRETFNRQETKTAPTTARIESECKKVLEKYRMKSKDIAIDKSCYVCLGDGYYAATIVQTRMVKDEPAALVRFKDGTRSVFPEFAIFARTPHENTKNLGDYLKRKYTAFQEKYKKVCETEAEEADRENLKRMKAKSLSANNLLDDEDLRDLSAPAEDEGMMTRDKRIKFLEEQHEIRKLRSQDAMKKKNYEFAYREVKLSEALQYVAESLKDVSQELLSELKTQAQSSLNMFKFIINSRREPYTQEQEVEMQRHVEDMISHHKILSVVRSINQGKRRDGRAYNDIKQSWLKNL